MKIFSHICPWFFNSWEASGLFCEHHDYPARYQAATFLNPVLERKLCPCGAPKAELVAWHLFRSRKASKSDNFKSRQIVTMFTKQTRAVEKSWTYVWEYLHTHVSTFFRHCWGARGLLWIDLIVCPRFFMLACETYVEDLHVFKHSDTNWVLLNSDEKSWTRVDGHFREWIPRHRRFATCPRNFVTVGETRTRFYSL